jgi:outer membrane beta-barrel protein
MEGWIRIFLLRAVAAALAMAIISGCAGRQAVDGGVDESEAVIQPEVERREIKPAKIDTEDFEIGAYIGIKSVEDFETNAVYGARLAYHISENFFIEGTYGRTDVGETSFEKLSGGAPILTDSQREYSYYDLSAGYNLLPGEVFFGRNRAFSSALYVLAGAGNTDFAGDDYFTIVIGAGYRMLLKDWLATHITVRDHMFSTDLLGSSKTTHNIEMTLSLTTFF